MHHVPDSDAVTGTASGAVPRAGAAAGDSGVQAAAEQALQETCSALLALQTSLEFIHAIPGDHAVAEGGLSSAIESVRLVVVDLRELLTTRDPPLAFGFVNRRRRG